MIRVGGTWQDIDSCGVRVSGTWRTVDSMHIRVGGTWREVWPGYTNISASISPSGYTNTVAVNTGPYSIGFSAIVTGGDGTETYTWTVTNTQGSAWSIASGQGTDSVIVQCADGFNEEFLATLECLVSDGTSSDEPLVNLEMIYGIPP